MGKLDLADIQGNIHRPYGRFGFPHSRHLFFHIADAAAGRRFVDAVVPRVTTAEPWAKVDAPDGTAAVVKPPITLNIGFSWLGLHALDLPTHTLRLLPDEFIDGMGCRAAILGDIGESAPARWDPIWHAAEDAARPAVHLWVSLNVAANPDGSPLPELATWTEWLESLTSAGGVTLLTGHGADGTLRWQDSTARMAAGPGGTKVPVPLEHFGFTDGISDPVFDGQFDGAAAALAVKGGGKIAEGIFDVDTSWSALATGEFILGHVDEGQELPVTTQPQAFARNGTFMVYRKLRQDVPAFEAEMTRQAAIWQQVTGLTDDEEAGETVRAKIVGRWRNGIPLLAAPTYRDSQAMAVEAEACIAIALRKPRDSVEQARVNAYRMMLNGFRYGADVGGGVCPLGAHVRRANPRDMLDPQVGPTTGSSTLTNRRRLLRRGLPYEQADGERGVIFMGICASLFRQFEFIQQQWMNYGLDFEAGNDGCPLIGNRAQLSADIAPDKHVVPAGPANAVPFIAIGLPQFVATRGGEYFFVPGIGALRMIAMGTTDPT